MRTRIILLVIALCLCIAAPAAAQQAMKVFTSADRSFSFVYPGDWLMDDEPPEQRGQVSLTSKPMLAMFEPPYGIMLQINFPQTFPIYPGSGTTPVQMVKDALWFSQGQNRFFDPTNSRPIAQIIKLNVEEAPITEFTVNGRPAARFRFSLDDSERGFCWMLTVVDVADGYFVAVLASTVGGGAETIQAYEPVILAILQSMQFVPPPPA